MAITLTQLRSFLAVVKTGSVTAAADELIVTQPSVSAAVSALSRELGVELTERVGRSIQTTPAGKAFAPYAGDVIGMLEQGARAAREAAEVVDREVRIAAVTTAGEYIVPSLIEAFSARFPDVRLTVEVANRARVFERVRRHEADVGIGGRPPSDGGIVGTKLFPNPIVLIGSPSDKLTTLKHVSAEQIATRPWLLREEGSGTRTMTEEFLASHGLEVEKLTLGSNGAIKQATQAGLGVSLQAELAVRLELELGLLVAIRPRGINLPQRDWYLLRPASARLRPAVEQFMRFATSPEVHRAVDAGRLPQGERAVQVRAAAARA
jgi:DNA-binding transcriptional LysR family regulator